MARYTTVNNLLNQIVEAEKTDYDFADALNLSNCLSREIYVGLIDDIGDSVESTIRFWNRCDDEANIPVEEREPIKIYIDSPGGNLTETFTMINAVEMSKTPVYTINIGMAYSGGFFLFLAGHKRFAYGYSSFLYHEGSVGNQGTANQFANFAGFYKKQLEQLREHTLRYTTISPDLYEDKRRDDWWLTADEALELGICDEIIKNFVTDKIKYKEVEENGNDSESNNN